VETETFVDASIKISKTLDLFGGCNEFIFSTELLIKLLVDLVLDLTVSSEVVENST
jgi:hypothetical protein